MDKNAAKEDAMSLKNAFVMMGGVENSATKKVTNSHYTAYWVAVGVTAGVLLAIGIIFYLPRCHSRMNPVQVKRKAPGSPFTRFLSHN